MSYINSHNSIQATYSPVDYTFKWTYRHAYGVGLVPDWYEFNAAKGRSLAIKARNAEVKRLRSEGWTVTTFSLAGQRISRGGIGTGGAFPHPHVELVVNVYGFNAWR